MKAKIHASVAVGERRSVSSVAHATSTQSKYDPAKISNHGICMNLGYLASLAQRIARHWDAEIVPELVAYIRVPAKSPHFDRQWKEHGHIDAVVEQARAWAARQPIAGLNLEVVRLEGRTPLLFFDAPANGKGASAKTCVLYGHLDKQPE